MELWKEKQAWTKLFALGIVEEISKDSTIIITKVTKVGNERLKKQKKKKKKKKKRKMSEPVHIISLPDV